MSDRKSARLQATLGVGLLLLLVALSFVSELAPSESDRGTGSVHSSAPDGRRALFLLLGDLGFAPEAWSDAPGELPRGSHVLWLAKTPSSAMPGLHVKRRAGGKDADASTEVERIGAHALEGYQRFVENGGTLVMEAGDDTTAFLADELGFDACRDLALDAARNTGTRALRTLQGETFRIDVDSIAMFQPLDPNGDATELLTATSDTVEQPFAVSVPIGAGSVVLLASDRFVGNEHIGKFDHAAIAVRLVEELRYEGRLLFDEYELGAWRPASAIALVLSPKLVLASLHVTLLLALFVWFQAFARAFPRDPEPHELYAPLLRARAQAGLLVAADRPALLASILRRGSFARVCRIARVLPGSSRRTGDKTGPDDKSTPVRAPSAEEIERFAIATDLARESTRLRELFNERKITTRAELDELDRDLRELENEVQERRRGSARRRE
jgi:hypothetical protein